MELRVIKTKEDHEAAMRDIETLAQRDLKPDTSEVNRLEVLATLVEAYEKAHFPIEKPDPISAIRFRMEQQGLSQADLVPFLGSRSRVSEVLSGKRRLSLRMIRALSDGLGISANILIGNPKFAPVEDVAAEPTEIGMLSARDVAAYILKKLGRMTAMKLQKLVYFSQAWSLVWNDAPLFREEIQAWVNGPVVRELYEIHRGQFEVSSVQGGNAESLSDKAKETVDAVLGFYGDKSAQWLSDLTHMERPWREARSGLASVDRSERTITFAMMSEYYSGLPGF